MRAGRDGGWLVSASLGLGLRIGQLGKNRGKLSRIDHTSISQEFQLLHTMSVVILTVLSRAFGSSVGDEHTVRTMRSDRVVMAAEKSLAILEKNVW